MAYPSVDAAYGFKPINELNGLPYAGAIRQIPIARNYGTAIFNGDLIELIANGEQPGTWGTTTNVNLGTLIESAIAAISWAINPLLLIITV